MWQSRDFFWSDFKTFRLVWTSPGFVQFEANWATLEPNRWSVHEVDWICWSSVHQPLWVQHPSRLMMFLFLPMSFMVSISLIRSIISRSVASFFNILTATVVRHSGVLLFKPDATASITRPNAPSPSRDFSSSLTEEEKFCLVRFNGTINNLRSFKKKRNEILVRNTENYQKRNGVWRDWTEIVI